MSPSATRAPGFLSTDQQHLFEPFFTGFDTLRHSSGDYQFGKRGIGLGLWLVKTFVELHGGRVEVSSTPGNGSTFSFLLPRSQAASAESSVEKLKEGSPINGEMPLSRRGRRRFEAELRDFGRHHVADGSR